MPALPSEIHIYHHILHEHEGAPVAGDLPYDPLAVLETIDPAQLQQAALNQEEWGESRSHTEIVLDLIKEVFRGIEPQRPEEIRRG